MSHTSLNITHISKLGAHTVSLSQWHPMQYVVHTPSPLNSHNTMLTNPPPLSPHLLRASLLAMTAAHYFAPGEKNTAKIMAVGTIALWPAVAMNAFGGDPANVEMMWKMQIFAHTAICYILYSAGF